MSEQGSTPEEDKPSGQPAQELAQNGPKPRRAALLGGRTKTVAALAFAFCLVLAFFLLRHKIEPAGTSEGGLELGVGHNRLVHLCEPMASVSLSDPSIADLRVVSPDLIYVFAKKIGTTNIALIAAKPNPGPSNQDKERGPQSPRQSTIRLHVAAEPPSGATSQPEPKSVLEV